MKVWTFTCLELSNLSVVQVAPPGNNLFSYQLEWSLESGQNYGAQLGFINYEGGLLNCSGLFYEMAISSQNVTLEVVNRYSTS